MENNLENNRAVYKKFYNFEKFCKEFSNDFEPKKGETCEHYYHDFSSQKISLVSLNVFINYPEDADILEVVSNLSGEILEPKGKYEALRFKINNKIYFLHRRFRANTHYKFDSNFIKDFCAQDQNSLAQKFKGGENAT